MSINNGQAVFGLSAQGTGDRPWISGSATIGQLTESMVLDGCDIAFSGVFYAQASGEVGTIDLTNAFVTAITGSPTAAVAAALTTALTGINNDIVWTAATAGEGGNSITMEYVITSGSTVVTVTGKAITVTCASGTLASAVKTAVAGTPAAAALVTSANAGGNDATGAITAMSALPLTGGKDGTAWISTNVDFQGDSFPATWSVLQGVLIWVESGVVVMTNSDTDTSSIIAAGGKSLFANPVGAGDFGDLLTLTSGSADTRAYIAILAKS